jgi:MoaA/NifB/PqqE/SkfB family radical SAM enzyme
LSGGEVSLRSDFFDIMQEAKRRNFAISVYTNGQVSSEWIEKLITFFPQTVGVSLYSANPEIHDATTLRKGSFEQSVRAIETFAKHGIRTTIKNPLMNHTIHGYKELLNLCDRLDGIPQFDVHICPATDGDCSCTVHQILDSEILALICQEPRIPLYVDLDTPSQGRARRAMDDSVCGAGQWALSICPDGTIFPCNSLPIPFGNVRDGGIKKIWESSESLIAWKKVTWSDFNECGLYTDCAYCNFCPGMSMLETGDLFGKSKTCCTTAKVRRNVASDLRNNKDSIQVYAEKHNALFGMDMAFRSPTTACVIPWTQRFKEIRLSGNSIRKTIVPEDGSPADENLTKEMLVGTARFFELGR